MEVGTVVEPADELTEKDEYYRDDHAGPKLHLRVGHHRLVEMS